MSADIIALPTASPSAEVDPGPDHDYILELEHENAELRDIIAKGELKRWRSLPSVARRVALAVGLVGAFITGWFMDPPLSARILSVVSPTMSASSAKLTDYGCRIGV